MNVLREEWHQNPLFNIYLGGSMIEKKVRELIEKDVNAAGVVIDSIVYEKENGNYFLRIVIDNEDGIDIDKCVEITNIVNPLLDNVNIIDDSYILDISSKEKGV